MVDTLPEPQAPLSNNRKHMRPSTSSSSAPAVKRSKVKDGDNVLSLVNVDEESVIEEEKGKSGKDSLSYASQ